MTASTSTLELVGWDDVKCRPIYQRRTVPVACTKATKAKAHAQKGAGTARVDVRAAPTTTRAVEEALPTVTAAGEKKTKRSTVGGGYKRGKARTISLSPVQDAQKEVSRGRSAVTGVIARGDNAPSPLTLEGGAGKCVVGAAKFATDARKRKKGYGASKSHAPGNAAASMGWGVERAVDEFAPWSTNDKCGEVPVESDSPSLEEEAGEEAESELSVGSADFASDYGRQGDGGESCSPSSTRSVNSLDESEGANRASGDENMGDDASLHDAASSFSPNSNISWGNHRQDEEPNHQREQSSPMRFSDDESSSSSHPAHELPIDGPAATPQKAKDGQSPPPSTVPHRDIDTPSSIVRSDNGTSPVEQTPQTKNEGSYGSPRIDERYIAANNGTASGEPPNDTPFSKGGESTNFNSPYVYKRRDTDSNEMAEFDITFDDAEPDARTNPKRRSYGDVKPIWMASKDPSSSVGASQPAEVIGWDDTKCRPIYHDPPAQASTAQAIDSSKVTSPAIADEEATDPSDGDGSGTNPKRTQRKRVYTSLFNKKSGLSQAARDRMDVDSPVGIRQDQVPRATMAFEVPNGNDEATAGGKNGKTKVAHSEGQPATLLDVDLEMEAIMNDSNTQQPQPTSKSSLESARAFFRYLDSNHNLTILDQGNPTPKAKADVIRTNRRIYHCEQLRAEYVEYCKTVSGTGVDPISLNEFANNWNQYFTDRGVVRDGLLDEE